MVLAYYQFKVKEYILQSVLQLKLRKKKIIIGANCIIAKQAIIGANCQIRDSAIIGPKTILLDSVIIGRRAQINNISIGENTQIEKGVVCTGTGVGRIVIGEESYIGINNILDWSNNITIGDHVHVAGPSTGLWTHSSAMQALAGLPLNNKNIEYRPTLPIIIENNVYVGGNFTCLIRKIEIQTGEVVALAGAAAGYANG